MKDIQIEEKYRRQAEKLHRENLAVDAHLDLAGEVLIRRQLGERDIVRHHYLDDWKRGGFSLIVSSVFVENRNLSNGFENALQQIDALKKDLADQIVSKGGISFGELTKDDILKMIEESRP